MFKSLKKEKLFYNSGDLVCPYGLTEINTVHLGMILSRPIDLKPYMEMYVTIDYNKESEATIQ